MSMSGSLGRASGRRSEENEETTRKPVHIKLVLVGESNVGKSSIVDRYVNNNFRESPEGTIGAAYLRKELHLPDGTTIKFEIWDTAGQENTLAPMYYRGAQAAVVVYDTTNYDSFVKAKDWVRELERHVLSEVVTALAGNKADASPRQVPTKEALAYAQENGLAYFETSARKGTNIADMFLSIARTYAETVAAKSAGREPDVRRNKYAILEGTVESVDAAEPQAKSKCCT